jgi:zinc transport system substrate-binding protein
MMLVRGNAMVCRVGSIFLGLVMVVAGCDQKTAAPNSATGTARISVLATVYPLADVGRQVGGKLVDVQWLAEGAQRPEDVEPSNELKVRANNAQLLITSGGWDDWALRELSADARNNRVVEPGHTEASRGAGPKAYLWLDPAVMREMAEATRMRLTLITPRHDGEFRENAKAFTDEVEKVDEAYRAGLAGMRGRKVLAVRPVWGALCARYGLTLLAPVDAREEELKAEDFKELSQVAKAEGLHTIFIDVSTAAGVRLRIEERTGLKAITLDAMGSSAADGRNTWAGIMRYDLEQLKGGLK